MKTHFFSWVLGASTFFWGANSYAQKVNYIGSMSEMGKENFAPHIRLDTIPQKTHFFGLGPLGRMQGEITVLNGKPFGVSVNQNGEGIVSVNWKTEAPFFVYANVEKWKSFTFKANINNLADLQQAVAEIAKKNGYDLTQAFAFRLVGTFAKLTTHIVMPRSEEVAGFQANKKQADYDLLNQQGELLGFYSQNHQGIYTHKDSYIHAHFVNEDFTTMGHIDKIQTEKASFVLYLPQKGKIK